MVLSGSHPTLRRIIQDATGTDRTDLGQFAVRLHARSHEPKWAHPVFPDRERRRLKVAAQSLAGDLRQFHTDWTADPPMPLMDQQAVPDAIAALERLGPVIEEVASLAAKRRAEIEGFDGRKLTKPRNFRARMVALEAAIIFEELTGALPMFSKSQTDPFRLMVIRIFAKLGIEAKDLDGVLKWALEKA